LKQVVSNLYLGGSAGDGDRPVLSQNREPFKVDVRNGRISFMSRSGTRLCADGNTLLVWRNNPENNKDRWDVQVMTKGNNQGSNQTGGQGSTNMYPDLNT